MSSSDGLRVGFVGPAVGRNAGWVTTQGEVLADHFARSGFSVRETSSALHPLRRAAAVGSDVVRWGRGVDVLVVSVYSGRSFWYADLATALARVLRRPTVGVLHGGNLPAYAARHPRRVARVLERFNRLVVPSAYLGRWCGDHEWEAVEIPNVLPPAPYQGRELAKARPRLLWLRSFDEIHDPLLAPDVVARLADDHPDVSLTMAGQAGPLREVVEERCHRPDVRDRVRLSGFLEPDEKACVFADHDVFLHTSRLDHAPVSVLEAMAWGLVVVGTSVGGMPDLVADGATGLLAARAGDLDALAATVDRALGDADLAARSAGGRVEPPNGTAGPRSSPSGAGYSAR